MIISRQAALKLLKDGKACDPAIVYHSFTNWVAITRLDVKRFDHFQATEKDMAQYSEMEVA